MKLIKILGVLAAVTIYMSSCTEQICEIFLESSSEASSPIGLCSIYLGVESLDNNGINVFISQKQAVPYVGAKLHISAPEDILTWFVLQKNAYDATEVTTGYYVNGDTCTLPSGYELLTVYFGRGEKENDGYSLSGKYLGKDNVATLINSRLISISYEANAVEQDNAEVEKKIRSYINNLPCLSHISDVHGDAIRYERFLRYSQHIGVSAAINTGDSCPVCIDDGLSFLFQGIKDYPELLQINCIGNHDALDTHEQNYKLLIKPYADVYGYALATEKSYYYKDLEYDKIRIIVLNVYDEGHICNACAFGKNQIEWFIQTLASTQPGYGVVVVTHSSSSFTNPIEANEAFYNKNAVNDWTNNLSNITGYPIIDIIDAFIGRKKLSSSYTQLVSIDSNEQTQEISYSCDFTSISLDTEFVAHVNGHKHTDLIGVLSNSQYKQVNLNITQGVATPYYDDNMFNDIPRGGGRGSCQDAFNIYAIDRAKKQIIVCRVGSNFSYDYVDRESLIIEYL